MKPRKYISTLALCFSIVGTVFAQWEWADNVTRVGSLTLGRNVVDLAFSGEYAYCADNYGLSVWDLSEPERPEEIARQPAPGYSWSVAIQGSYAYVADYGYGLQVFDISDPRQPRIVYCLALANLKPGNYHPKSTKIIIRNETLLLSAPHRFWIISIRNPARPVVISESIPGNQHVSDFALNGDIVYLSQDSRAQLLVVNIQDLAAPQVVEEMDIPFIYAIALHDTILYCVADTSGDRYNSGRLYVLSLSNPEAPELIGSYPQYEESRSLFLDGSYSYLSGWFQPGINARTHYLIYDISNPSNLQLIADNDTGIGGSRQLKYENYCIAAASYGGLASYSLENRERPISVSELLPKYELRAFDIDGDHAFVNATDRGFLVVDIDNLQHPNPIAELINPNQSQLPFVKKYGQYVFFGGAGIICDVREPSRPDSVGDFRYWTRFNNPTSTLHIRDGYGYLPFSVEYDFDPYNLLVLDLRDPAHPDSVAIFNDIGLPMPTSSMEGDLLFQTGIWNYPRNDQFPHVFVYSLQEPGRPRLLGHWPFGPDVQWEPSGTRIIVHNHYAYIWCALVNELWIYNVENPVDPRFIGRHGVSIDAISGMAVDGDILYMGGYSAGFGCLSLADPENPEIVGYYDTPGSVFQIMASYGYVYVADDFEFGIYDCAELHGIWDVRISDQTHDFGYIRPDSAAVWELTLTNVAQQSVEITAVIIDSVTFSTVFDDILSLEPDESVAIPVRFAPTEARDFSGTLTVHTERRNVKMALTGTGIPLSAQEEESKLPQEFMLHSPYPNPFNSTTVIRYDVPHRSQVRLTVYDLAGRIVETLLSGEINPGRHSTIWNSRSNPAGIYFVRFESIEKTTTTKALLIK